MKRCIAQTGNKTGVLQQKHLVQLDWAPTEDGGHVLTVAVGSKIFFFCPVNNDVAESAQLVAKSAGWFTLIYCAENAHVRTLRGAYSCSTLPSYGHFTRLNPEVHTLSKPC